MLDKEICILIDDFHVITYNDQWTTVITTIDVCEN